jgi:replicative DNA helicase
MDSIFEITEKLIPSLTKALKRPQGVSGLSTGFEVLDRLTGGWQNGELIVVAAPEYMGKTALALSMLKNTMCDSEFETFWFSTGLSNLQLTKMLICKCMSLDMHKLISGEVDINILNSLIEKLKFSGVYFDDSPYLTIDDIDAKLSERFKSFPVELVIIDDINHLNYSERNYNDFNDKFYQLKTLARKYEIPIIVLMDIEISAADNADYSDCLSAYYQQHSQNSCMILPKNRT